MCDADEREAGSAAVTKLPFHEWVIHKARFYELQRRSHLSQSKLVDTFNAVEEAELGQLKRYKSEDDDAFALQHVCEAIAHGVIIPADHVTAVCEALVGAYHVFDMADEYLSACDAVVAALAVLGIPASELPPIVGSAPPEEDDDDEDEGEDDGGAEDDADPDADGEEEDGDEENADDE